MPILAGELNHELRASPINPENGHFSTKKVKKWAGKAKIQFFLYQSQCSLAYEYPLNWEAITLIK